MNPLDLLKTAYKLIPNKGKPKQSDLLRALSTGYYVLFHILARNCADMMIGQTKAKRSKPAWVEVYRALNHGTTKSACSQNKMIGKFPAEIQDFAHEFVSMQKKRHNADYDPYYRVSKSEVLTDLAKITNVIDTFSATDVINKRAFAAYVLFYDRKRQ